ncbi:MAG: hypothetical protein JOZ28_02230 [Candidatus Eremiobacteraeota bacterium]|nr:hypothetical protein [Candidatus Eremiobacteraeota bacterium]
MRETDRRYCPQGRTRQRGFAMAFVFVLVALLLLIAILIITGAFNANNQAQAVGVKYGVLNSAEAAANLALNQLAENPSEPAGCVMGSLNGASYRSCLAYNNLLSGSGVMSTDYANGQPLFVPPHSGYIYGEATSNGNRKAYVEAIAQPAPPLPMPPGAVNAAQNVNDMTSMPIQQDPLHTNDADIHANNNITVGGGSPSPVQGSTFAVGTDSLPGWNTVENSGYSATGFPNATQIAEAAQTAKAIAQTGASMTGAAFSATTATYTGNLYVNGDVNINSAAVTLGSGNDVYINGNLCISGTGSLVNTDGSQGILVVNGVVSSTGTGGYVVPLGNNTLMLVLANDPGSINPCGVSATDAISLAPAGGTESVGTVYASSGSVCVTGNGLLQGAFDAGNNVDLSGLAGSALQYDAKQAQTTLATGTMTYTAYNQD